LLFVGALAAVVAATAYSAFEQEKQNAARLNALKASNPDAYFDELLVTDMDRWHLEVGRLSDGQKKAITGRAVKSEKAKLAALPATDHDAREAVFRTLMLLEPGNDAYRISMLNEGAARVRAEKAAHMLPTDYGKAVLLSDFSWRKGGFDTVFIANFTLKNLNDKPVRDIEISCEARAPSGTLLGNPTTVVYDRLMPNKPKKFRDISVGFVHSQAQRASCEVTRAHRDG
jgi:hypothetical protein